MRYLLDTNIISEPAQPRPSPRVVRWLSEVPRNDVAISAMTLGELRKGAEQLRPRNPTRAHLLDAWLARTIADFGDRIIGIGVDIADAWGRLEAEVPRRRVDGLIAATALVRGWVVATRNVRDFERMGVETYNPFEVA